MRPTGDHGEVRGDGGGLSRSRRIAGILEVQLRGDEDALEVVVESDASGSKSRHKLPHVILVLGIVVVGIGLLGNF